MPLIDKDFIVCSRAYAPAPWTVPSLLSLFTGLYASEAMESKTSFQLNGIFKTLSDLFKDSGYRTAGFSANSLISRKFGFDRGFDRFFQMWLPDPEGDDTFLDFDADNNFERLLKLYKLVITGKNKRRLLKGIRQKLNKKFINDIYKDATRSTGKSMKMLKQDIEKNNYQKSFYFLNLMQTHEKYNPPACTRNIFVKDKAEHENYYKVRRYQDHYAVEPFSEELLKYLELLYDQEILYLDLAISDLFYFLKDRGLYDKSLIILTSDHGEQHGEHGHYTHVFSVYEPVIKIPLYIKWPGRSDNNDKTRGELVMLQDLYSTFLNLLNHWHPCPNSSIDLNSSHKRSWIISQLPDMSHDIKRCLKERQTFSVKELGLEEENLTAYVYDDGIKIIENGSKILCYNLRNDPEEIEALPISSENREKIKRIKDTLM